MIPNDPRRQEGGSLSFATGVFDRFYPPRALPDVGEGFPRLSIDPKHPYYSPPSLPDGDIRAKDGLWENWTVCV